MWRWINVTLDQRQRGNPRTRGWCCCAMVCLAAEASRLMIGTSSLKFEGVARVQVPNVGGRGRQLGNVSGRRPEAGYGTRSNRLRINHEPLPEQRRSNGVD